MGSDPLSHVITDRPVGEALREHDYVLGHEVRPRVPVFLIAASISETGEQSSQRT
jgi:hypothetical protein